MIAAAVFLLAVQGEAEASSSEGRDALIETRIQFQVMDACATGPRRDAFVARYEELRAEAAGLLPFIIPNIGEILNPIRCRRMDMRRARPALDRLAAAIARRRSAMRGLWIGPLHLCAGAVLAVEETKDDQQRAAIQIRFSPSMTEAIARETTQRVRTQLPIVLDGRTLVEPMVNEPILGGVISLAGGEPLAGFEGGAVALRAATDRPCDD